MINTDFLKNAQPRQLFLVDSIGALVSTLMLGVVLVQFEDIFGMPAETLYVLAGLALLFAIYSLTCFLLNVKNWQPFLRAIAIINITYCVLTMILVFVVHQGLTTLGSAYFIGEVIIVVSLAVIELKKVRLG